MPDSVPPTIVTVGNADALEMVNVYDPETKSEQKMFNPAPGERVTTLHVDSDLSLMHKMQVVIRFLQEMMNPTARPWWIECDDETLRTMLCEHYGLRLDAVRPPQWGDGTTVNPEPKASKTSKKKSAAAKTES